MPIRHFALLAASVLTIVSCNDTPTSASSTIIVNAIVFDGTGAAAYNGAIRIDDDRIVAVGELTPLAGETIVDAGGLALAPGFIDTHSHHDNGLDEYRHMPGVLSQGVTTIVRGVDGFALVSQAEFNEVFAAAPAATNIASYSPHNSIRRKVMGDDNRRTATSAEIDKMAAMVAADMQAGAIGLATGLEYEPGIFSAPEEVIALAKIAAQYGGSYASHLRDEDDRFMAAVNEIIQIGREANLPVHISHIKLADRAFWGTTGAVIELLDAARSDGIDITADIYPYERWASNLAVLFPDRDYTDRDVAEFTFAHTAAPDDIILARYPPNPAFNGLSIAEVAALTERDPATTLMDLAQAADDYRTETGRSGAAIIAKGMDEADVAAFMQWEYTNICSDGEHGGGHPRGYGAFPRVLGRYVRDLGILSLQEAIYKMTGRAADAMGFRERGRIKPGNYADLVLFDPGAIADRATMANPTAVSVGIQSVWVNGVLAFENGAPTKRYAGRIVTHRK